MVTRSLETAEIEKGIDALPSPSNDIVVMWHKHPQSINLEKYILYRGEEISNQIIFTNIFDIEANFNLDTLHEDKGLSVGTMYYYYIVAVDENNNRSIPSDTVKYQLLEKPQLEDLSISNNTYLVNGVLTNPSQLIFRTLQFTAGASAGSILRIEKLGSRELVYFEYIRQFQNADGFAVHEIVGETLLQSLFKNRDDGNFYEWRIDLADNFSLNRGSESEWNELSIKWGN
ncbi:MAG: hypothetical protein D8M58_19455 [Calditrichaeota bacterium]|nr:MAG: hypothetical protein DWQ03_22135 [Calditrichota bacterium]MBL1207589.1 hypothetical protein [Calditrichota bacterium]NOG47422.1 hypothetical protein [Calditrichota bacterium]